LLEGWNGVAAEEAASRLAALAERVARISELAAAGQRAAQDSADALAAARAAMPAPPDGTAAAFAGFPATFALPSAPAPFALPSAPAPFALPNAPAPLALPSAPTMPAGSGFYFYFGAAAADQQKAQAVRTMQTYESSLNGSSRLIDTARATVPQAARAAAVAPVRTPSSGGVPWQRLVGSSPPARGPVAAANPQLSPGTRTGVMVSRNGVVAAAGPVVSDTRASAQNNGMAAPPPAGGRKDDDQHHENQMPTLDHDLFAVTGRVSPAVIGEEQ
jgi:hypothetical protein